MDIKFKVLITHPIPETWIGPIFDQFDVIVGPNDMMGLAPELEKHLPEVDGLITFLCDKITKRQIDLAPKLKVICNLATGTDNIDLKTCNMKRIPVGSTPGVLTNATADLTIGLMLAVNRQILTAARDAKAGKWKMWYPDRWLGQDLDEATLGIIGMGKIGTAVAKRARSCGMKILYTSRTEKPEVEITLEAKRVPLEMLLEQSDVVSLHAPLTTETHHLIDQKALRRMKPTSTLINTARGSEVDTEALYDALNTGEISAAGLDVTDPEPLPPEHPLYTLPNCLILPHIGSASESTRKKMAEMTCENLIAGLYGRKLPYCANPEIYS